MIDASRASARVRVKECVFVCVYEAYSKKVLKLCICTTVFTVNLSLRIKMVLRVGGD